MSGIFGYSRQAYYHNKQMVVYKEEESETIKQMVIQIRHRVPMVGTRKLQRMLWTNYRFTIGRDKLFKILRDGGMLIRRRRKYAITTNSKHWLKKYNNLVKDKQISMPEEVYVSDITYIPKEKGFKYLSLVTDAYSKKIMGYELSDSLTNEASIKALKMAINNRQYNHTLIHHSDRGMQYCSKQYVTLLNKYNIQISMTNNGNPYENAIAERINGILKQEFGLGEIHKDDRLIEKLVRDSIKIYNNERLHLSCNYLTPEQAHKLGNYKMKSWKKNYNKKYNLSNQQLNL